jgi:hypothetical protein
MIESQEPRIQLPFTPETRLVFQGSIQVESAAAGETLYKELQIWLKSWTSKITINGQIIRLLEPCCKEKKT